MKSNASNTEIWNRLVQGMPLNALVDESRGGRLDLRGMDLPNFGSAVVRGVSWRNIDFTGCTFSGLNFFQCELINCTFERCQFRDFGAWATKFMECNFRRSNLRKAVLGGVEKGVRNVFIDVDFSDADLRETVYKAAGFEGCRFCRAKLVKIDFQSSTFVECVFEGELRDVLFYRRGFEGGQFPENEMINVDFSRAQLHDVSFRGLELDRVKMPQGEDHLVITNVPTTLDWLIEKLKGDDDVVSKRLIAFLEIDRKWVVPDQAQSAINLQDLAETVGASGVERLHALLHRRD